MATKASAAHPAPSQHNHVCTHGTPPRGQSWVQHSPLDGISYPREMQSMQGIAPLQGRFGRMFPNMRGAQFGKTEPETLKNLETLGALMSAAPDKPTDDPDPEESGIPALYTYFGQFIDHDLTFDPNSSLQKQNDPYALVDYRTPAFDLDNIYGRGPSDQPYLYKGSHADGPLRYFMLGTPLTGGDPGAFDLARNSAHPARALIGDPRNDENVIVSQLQGLFLRFHNRTMQKHSHESFEDVQQRVRLHYQFLVLQDFLPQIVHPKVLDELTSGSDSNVRHYERSKLKFFDGSSRYIPVEFSLAAYRMGHSMVRPGYRLNDNDETRLPIFSVSGKDLRGFQSMPANFGIDWARFINTELRPYDGSATARKQRLQFAYKIDTSLVNPLSNLPLIVASGPIRSLAQRNLVRGFQFGLPSGQNVARAMGVKPLDDKEIWIGQAVAGAKHVSILDALTRDKNGGKAVAKHFEGNCPLWTYILAEAMHHQENVPIPVKGKPATRETPKLGPVGGRIVAEVFLGLMFGDPHSMLSLQPNWHPERGSDYRLKDFVEFALQDGRS